MKKSTTTINNQYYHQINLNNLIATLPPLLIANRTTTQTQINPQKTHINLIESSITTQPLNRNPKIKPQLKLPPKLKLNPAPPLNRQSKINDLQTTHNPNPNQWERVDKIVREKIQSRERETKVLILDLKDN